MKRVFFIGLLGVCLLYIAGCSSENSSTNIQTNGDVDEETTDVEKMNVAEEFTAVELDSDAPATLKLAIRACSGLYNRTLGGSIYVKEESHDEEWLEELGLEPKETVAALDFLDTCTTEFPACVRYSYDVQQKLLPNILTIASALDAVPLDVEMSDSCSDIAFDAFIELAEYDTPYLATEYVFEHYADQTTGLAMVNPGYNTHDSNVADPELTDDIRSSVVDFVFSKKLFAVFLVNGCREESSERELLHNIVNAGYWSSPIGVYGYNNSWMVMGGYIYEAQTLCLDSRNMGAIPTMTGNLSFFSTRRAPIQDVNELQRNDPEEIEYDPQKTYVAFVIGDGDNIRFIMSTRNVWLRQRLEDCEKAENSCAPISWSISPHLATLAPDILEWYHEKTRQTGKDYFILPPSGHLYAYPSSLNTQDQDRFVTATERDANLLGIHSTVHWDWSGTWDDAENIFLPKYARSDGVIRGIFPVNVPYLLPTFPWWPDEWFYNILTGKDGGEVVVFRPREWRGIDDSDEFFLSPQNMADELANYPKGTVAWVYMTSDGGLSLENSFMEMVKILPSHVQLVSADSAAKLALEAGHR